MENRILDGKRVGQEIRSELKEKVDAWKKAGRRPPGLAAVLVGDDPASQIYVSSKVRACDEIGIFSEKITPGADATTKQLVDLVRSLNDREDIDGILVQLPLPSHVEEAEVLDEVDPRKDVDGFHPKNVGNLVLGRPCFEPCTPAGIMELLRRYEIPLSGARAVVVGRSRIVGKPMAALLTHRNATVTVCHSRTKDLPGVCSEADLLVAAIGRKAMISDEYIKEGAVVVDVGMNRVTEVEEAERVFGGDERRMRIVREKGSTLIGDVLPTAMWERASAYTPVPGGVGPLTIAMLMSNTVRASEWRTGSPGD